MSDKIVRVLACEHVEEPVFLVLSDTEDNARFETFSEARDEYRLRLLRNQEGVQVWADFGDYEVACDPLTGALNFSHVEFTPPVLSAWL